MFHNIKQNKDKRYHILITDNETGNTLVDSETSCIIGSYDVGDNGSMCLAYTNCPLPIILHTVESVESTIETLKNNPSIKNNPFFEFYKMLKRLGGKNE